MSAAKLRLVSVNEDAREAPLVPPGTRVGGDYMPFFGDQLLESGFMARATAVEFRAAVRLWWEAWNSKHTTGTLPNEEKTLADKAGYGGDIRSWRRIRDGAMHGFKLCSDGRWHHPTLAKAVRDVLARREKANEKKRREREAARGQDGHIPATSLHDHGKLAGNLQGFAGNAANSAQQNQALNPSCPRDVPQEGKGREGKVESTEPTDVGSGATAPPASSIPASDSGATTAPPPVITDRKGKAVDLSDPVAAARHKLWTEGRDILVKIDPALPLDDLRDLIGELVAAHGAAYGKSAGLPKAVQCIRDMEVEWLGGGLQVGVKKYLRKTIHNLRGTSRDAKAKAASAPERPSMTLARQMGMLDEPPPDQTARAAPAARSETSAPALPAGRVIDVDPEPDAEDAFAAFRRTMTPD